MHDDWTPRLSEYLDGDLADDDRVEFERHMATCEPCRTTLAELRAVVETSRALEDVPPSRSLWPAVEASIVRAPRRVTIPVWQLMAAGVFVAVVSGLSVWVLIGRDHPATSGREAAVVTGAAVQAVSTADVTYDRAVAELLQALDQGRRHLDPGTLVVLERSLGAIDRAISDATSALNQDPNNVFLTQHRARERQRKLALLRQVQELTEERQE